MLSEIKILAASSLNFHHCSSSCSMCSRINNHDTTEHVFLSRNARALAVMPQLVAWLKDLSVLMDGAVTTARYCICRYPAAFNVAFKVSFLYFCQINIQNKTCLCHTWAKVVTWHTNIAVFGARSGCRLKKGSSYRHTLRHAINCGHWNNDRRWSLLKPHWNCSSAIITGNRGWYPAASM